MKKTTGNNQQIKITNCMLLIFGAMQPTPVPVSYVQTQGEKLQRVQSFGLNSLVANNLGLLYKFAKTINRIGG